VTIYSKEIDTRPMQIFFLPASVHSSCNMIQYFELQLDIKVGYCMHAVIYTFMRWLKW